MKYNTDKIIANWFLPQSPAQLFGRPTYCEENFLKINLAPSG
jgi:hypothetical protein